MQMLKARHQMPLPCNTLQPQYVRDRFDLGTEKQQCLTKYMQTQGLP